MDVAVCVACGECTVILDPISGLAACEACGRTMKDDGPTLVSGREAQFNGCFGWQSGASSSGLQGMQTYDPIHWTDKKKRLALQSVEHVTACLRLPADKVEDVKHLLGQFFETGYGEGRWVEISVGAFAYIVIRQTHTPLTLPEVAGSLELRSNRARTHVQPCSQHFGDKIASDRRFHFPGASRHVTSSFSSFDKTREARADQSWIALS